MTAAAGERAHGTRARYVFGAGPGRGEGCRCQACTAASREEKQRIRRLQAYGRWHPFVDAEPARQRVHELAAAGIGLRRAAELAGVPLPTLQDLMFGKGSRGPSKQLRPGTAAAILAVPADPRSVAPGTRIDAAGTRRRLEALVAVGWSRAKLSEHLGVGPGEVSQMLRRDEVRSSRAQAVAGLYDRLWDKRPPESTPEQKVSVSRARNYARAHGWAPPAAWDDDLIDQADAKPAEGWQRSGSTRRPAAELAGEAAEVMAQGHTIDQAAERLGVTRSAIEQASRRAQAYAGRKHDVQRARFATAREAAQAPEYEAEAG